MLTTTDKIALIYLTLQHSYAHSSDKLGAARKARGADRLCDLIDDALAAESLLGPACVVREVLRSVGYDPPVPKHHSSEPSHRRTKVSVASGRVQRQMRLKRRKERAAEDLAMANALVRHPRHTEDSFCSILTSRKAAVSFISQSVRMPK